MIRKALGRALWGALCVPLAAAADAAYISQPTELRDAPAADGHVLQSLAAAAAVDIRRRQGGWYQVQVNQQTGWVRMSSLRLRAPGERAGLLDGGRALATQTVATTGVRGLSGEDLQKANPDLVAVAALDAGGVSAADARDFAAQGGLQARGPGTPPPAPPEAGQEQGQ
ncbi:MAG: SH3 domain-containing protein [Nevskia sp.]|nr:SH3 domain-containing protein [Nevskia sp.]